MTVLPWRPMPLDGGPAIATSLTEAETAALRRLAKDAAVLEIGSSYGYSTVAMALSGASVTAVDPHLQMGSLETMHRNLRAYRVAHLVDIIQATSQEVMPQLDPIYGLVFVDGDHTEEVVAHDVEWGLKLLLPGDVLACHDRGEATCPGVKLALDRLLGEPDEQVDTLAIFRGRAQ